MISIVESLFSFGEEKTIWQKKD